MLASSEDLLHTKATSIMTVVGQYPGRLDVTRRHHELVGSSDGLATREPRAPGLPPYTSCGVIPRCMNTRIIPWEVVEVLLQSLLCLSLRPQAW